MRTTRMLAAGVLAGTVLATGCGKAPTAAPPAPPTPQASRSAPIWADPEIRKLIFEQQCQHSVQESMKFLTDALDEVDTILPNMTPEETAYLEREERSIKKLYKEEEAAKSSHAASNARNTALVNRRLYRVWKARQELVDAYVSVDHILRIRHGARPGGSGWVLPPSFVYWQDGPDQLADMINATMYVGFTVSMLREFLLTEDYRSDRLLTAEQTQQLWMKVFELDDDLRFAMKCQLAHVVVDK